MAEFFSAKWLGELHFDLDGDGLTPCGGDCDDGHADTYPGAAELCDGRDNDCDGSVPADETDADNDGYFGGAGCGTPVDCNDDHATINPSASEVKNDGLDQNCNGYDLTIDITSIVYQAADDKLSVKATSALAADAGIDLSGPLPARRFDEAALARAVNGVRDAARTMAGEVTLALRDDPADPRQFTQRYLAFCLFYPGGALKMRGLLARSLDGGA